MWQIPSNLSFPSSSLQKSFGSWGGMAVIAIGPRGGKIVGYGSGGKPIYAGSPKAVELAGLRVKRARAQNPEDAAATTYEWLVEIGFPNKIVGDDVLVAPTSGKVILDSFGTKPHHTGSSIWKFSLKQLQEHVGKPLVPHGAEKVAWAAKAAAGDLDHDPFPTDLSTLTEIPAGKAAGSHGNKLFKGPDGRKWLFKTHDNVIARAEEAASRLGRLTFGKDHFAAAKYVKLSGKDGVLLEWKAGDEIPQDSYHQATPTFLKQYADQLVEHQVFDWLVSNHDSHAGNFLEHNGKLIVIDKGQSWRFFGKDKLETDYSPNPSKPVYVKLWALQQSGAIHQSKPELAAAVGRALDKIHKITPEQFMEIVKPYAITRAKKTGESVDSLLTDLTNRYNDLRADWVQFLSGTFNEPKHQIEVWMETGEKEPGKDNFETMPESQPAPEAQPQNKDQKAFALVKARAAWEAGLNVGDSVQVRWTNIGLHPSGVGTLVKVNAKSLVVELSADVDHAGHKWVKGQKIKVPRYGYDTKWSWAHTVLPVGMQLTKDTDPAEFGAAPTKPVIAEPDKPLVIEGGAKAPIVEKPAPGWPQTKGKVTVSHPGEPVPVGGDWPKGYPGPGFMASIEYKGKHYDVEFGATPSGGFKAKVYYPDGSSNVYDSANKASDSLYLHAKGLPLDMSATEKKAKGISYPASKAFGILAFKTELAESQGKSGAEPTLATMNEMTVAELEQKGLVETYKTAEQEKKSSLPNWETMPEIEDVEIPLGVSTAEMTAWLGSAPIGAVVYSHWAKDLFTKIGPDLWKDEKGDTGSGGSLGQAFGGGGTAVVPPKTASLPNWKTMEPGEAKDIPANLDAAALISWMDAAPLATKIYVTSDDHTYSKTAKGEWAGEKGYSYSSATMAAGMKAGGKVYVETSGTATTPKQAPQPLAVTLPLDTNMMLPTLYEQLVGFAPGTTIQHNGWDYEKQAAGNWIGKKGGIELSDLADSALADHLHMQPATVKEAPKKPLKDEVGPAPLPKQLAGGATHTVMKPSFGAVWLKKTSEGFTVGFKYGGTLKTQEFASISAAAKFAFIHMKGYETAEAYKAGTGKPPPGVSWGFFGLKPVVAAAAPTPAPAGPVWEEHLSPQIGVIAGSLTGTHIRILNKTGVATYWRKTAAGWQSWKSDAQQWGIPIASATEIMALQLQDAKAVHALVDPEFTTTPPASVPSPENKKPSLPAVLPVDDMTDIPAGASKVGIAALLQHADVGTQVATPGDPEVLTKQHDGSWQTKEGVIQGTNLIVDDLAAQGGTFGTGSFGAKKEPSPDNWETMPESEVKALKPGDFLNDNPLGTKVQFQFGGGHVFTAVRTPTNEGWQIEGKAGNLDIAAAVLIEKLGKADAGSVKIAKAKGGAPKYQEVPDEAVGMQGALLLPKQTKIEDVEKWTPGTLAKLVVYGATQYWQNVDGVWKVWHPLKKQWMDGPPLMSYIETATVLEVMQPAKAALPTAVWGPGDMTPKMMGAVPAGSKLVWKTMSGVTVTAEKLKGDWNEWIHTMSGAEAMSDKYTAADVIKKYFAFAAGNEVQLFSPEEGESAPAPKSPEWKLVEGLKYELKAKQFANEAPVGTVIQWIGLDGEQWSAMKSTAVMPGGTSGGWVMGSKTAPPVPRSPDYLANVLINTLQQKPDTEVMQKLDAAFLAMVPEAKHPVDVEGLAVSDLAKAPAETEIHLHSFGTLYKFVKPEAGPTGWVSYEKNPDGSWKHVESIPASDVLEVLKTSAVNAAYSPPMSVAPLAVSPTAAKKEKKAYPPHVLTTKTNLPSAVHSNIQIAMDMATTWSQKPSDDNPEIMLGMKPPTWAPWVPPPGVFIEGMIGGKKYWFVTAVTGFAANTGTPGDKLRFAVVDEYGNLYPGKALSAKNAYKALSSAFEMAVVHVNAAQLKSAFGLDKLQFAPGETYLSVKDGEGVSAIPGVTTVNPVDPKQIPTLQKKLVKHTQVLSEALESDTFVITNGVKVVQNEKTFSLVIDGTPSAGDVLDQLLANYGLKDIVVDQKTLSPTQATASVPTWALGQNVVVTTSHYEVLHKPQAVSPDNFETMPDYVPQTIKSNASEATLEKIIAGVPVGTSILTTQGLYAKHGDGWYSVETGNKLAVHMPLWIKGFTATVVPPGAEKPEFVPPVVVPQIPWKTTADQLAKTAKLQEVATWAKKYKPVSDAQTLRVLAHLQQVAPAGMEFWVRQGVTHSDQLLIGSDHPDFKKFWKQLGVDSVATKTPLGSFQRTTVDDLVAVLPGAQSMVGPDGQKYPLGTTFEEKQKHTTVKDAIEGTPGFYKWVEHKTDPTIQVLKVKGTGPEQIQVVQKFGFDYGIALPELPYVVGGSNLLGFFKKADLEKVLSTATEHVPTLPPQPPPFVAKGLPLGSSFVGDPAPVNREDLGVVASMKLGRLGHAIRVGKYGVFRDGQVFVRRVKDTDGKVWLEAYGTLANPDQLPTSLTPGTVVYKSTSGTDSPGYKYQQQTYDEETDAQVENHQCAAGYSGWTGNTAGGSTVALIKEPGKKSVDRSFRVRMPVDANVEQELSSAFGAMGLDPTAALATPTADDVRKETKLALVRALGGPAAQGNLPYSVAQNESALDERLGKNKAKLDSITWRWVGPGRQAPVFDDSGGDAASAASAGVKFVYVGMSEPASIVSRLREGLLASNKRRRQNGVTGNAASASSDEDHGGSWGVFMRFGNENTHGGWGFKCGGPKMIFHPRMLSRLDWYAHPDDSYGDAKSGSWTREKSYEFTGSNNEVMFMDSVSLRDLAGIQVDTMSEKQSLIEYAQQAGITQVNGIPLETLVFISPSGSRAEVIKSAPGLKEGVLP